MYTNTYGLEKWAEGHRELVAHDIREARKSQRHFFQRLSRVFVKIGSKIEGFGRQLQARGQSTQFQS